MMDFEVSAMTSDSMSLPGSRSALEPSDDDSFGLTEELELVEATNDLLREIGTFPKLITSFEELTKVASSMFVAIFENIFQVRLEGIARVPETYPDYVDNVQRVIDELSRCAGVDLSHISGESIVDGDRVAIQNLVRVFWRVLSVTKERSSHLSDHTSRQSHSSADSSMSSQHSYNTPLWQLQLRRQAVEDKVNRARVRKATLQKHSGQKRSLHSARHTKTVTSTREQRRLQEMNEKLKSLDMQEATQDEVMARNVYKQLLGQLHTMRRSEVAEVKERLDELRKQAWMHEQALNNLFNDRKAMIEECRQRKKVESEAALKEQQQLLREMAATLRRSHQRASDHAFEQLRIERLAQIRLKAHSHRALAELIAVEDWRGVNKDRFFSSKSAAQMKKYRRPSSAPSAGRGTRHARAQLSTSSTTSTTTAPSSSRQLVSTKQRVLSASNRRRNHTKLLYRGTL